MELAYVAHSARCALLLDGAGICRWFVMKSADAETVPLLRRCIGAQFVASLDPDADGFLGHEPEIGKRALFARIEDGRVSLIRFGPLVQFDRIESSQSSLVVPRQAAVVVARPTIPPDPQSDPTLEWRGRRDPMEDFDDLATVTDADATTRRPSIAITPRTARGIALARAIVPHPVAAHPLGRRRPSSGRT